MRNTKLYVCEDHFNLAEDMENYMRFKLMGGRKLMKPHIVPHIFNCQDDRNRASSRPTRVVAEKRAKRRLVEEAMASTSNETWQEISFSSNIPPCTSTTTVILLPGYVC